MDDMVVLLAILAGGFFLIAPFAALAMVIALRKEPES